MSEHFPHRVDNPDRYFIEQFMEHGWRDRTVPNSPLAQQFDMCLVSASRGRIDARFEIGSEFTQGGGVIQGGIVAAMLDFGLAFAALSVLDIGRTAVTTSLTVNYLRPAQKGSYRVEGQLDKQGRTLIYASARLFCDQDRLVATATSPMAIVLM
jgi:uncharacterized protein (TIGR00369 family)